MPDSLVQEVCRAADLLSCAWDAAAFDNEDTLTQCVQVPEPLFTMLAAEPSDLKGIDDQDFEKIGAYLAKFLIRHEPTAKRRKRKDSDTS
jgi:hypothetical protein